MDFEWDKMKALVNTQKHNISFAEATTVFSDPFELTIADPVHSLEEFRFISIGLSKSDNLLVVSYTERHQNKIRIISARKATKREHKYYEHRD